jgi:hypothetical protein
VVGFDEVVVQALRPIFPTVRIISTYDEVALNEWQALLTNAPLTTRERAIRCITNPSVGKPTHQRM